MVRRRRYGKIVPTKPIKPLRLRAAIVEALLKFSPDPSEDRRDAEQVAVLLIDEDWPTIALVGQWLFSDRLCLREPDETLLSRIRLALDRDD